VSWLRRILGGGSGDRPVDGSEPAPPSAGK
jgi:hypothetical protein